MASYSIYKSLLLITAFILTGSLLGGCTTSAHTMAPPSVPSMPVKLTTATEKVVEDASTFVATLKSRKSVNLKPQIEGRVLNILVTSGNHVTAGQPLMILDKSKQETLVSNTDAAIESAVAEEKNAIATLKSLTASRLSKVANLEFSEKQFERYRKLNEDGAISTESVDEKRTSMSIAGAELEAIDAQIKAQEAEIARAQKHIKQAKAARQEQIEHLKYFTVRAPFAGMIGDVPVKIGDYVTTDTMLTTVDQTKPLEVYVHVPTSLSSKLRLGLKADVVDNAGKSIESGKIFFISSQVDEAEQTVLAKAELPNTDERLRSGQTANCRVIWGQVNAVTIPVTSVSRFSGQEFVFVAVPGEENKLYASQRAVKLGQIEGNEYRVISGVKPGDRVVTSGIQNLSDGIPVAPSS